MRCHPARVLLPFLALLPAITVDPAAQQRAEGVQVPATTITGIPQGPPAPRPAGAQVPGTPAPGVPSVPTRDRRTVESERGTAAIRGQVIASDTGAPLRRALVRVMSQSPGGGSSLAQTDPQGRFEVTALPAGRYLVTASRSGYVSLTFGQRAPNQPGTPIELADGQQADKLNFVLARGGAISGRVVDEFGDPVSSAQVTVQRFAFVGGGRRLVGVGSDGGFDRTDDLGQFRVHSLPPGDYYLSATLRSMEFVGPMTTAMPGPSEGFAPTYYPGTTSVAEARRITVRAGQDVPNMSFALVPARMGRLSGRVTSSTGEPLAGGRIMVAPRSQETLGTPFGMIGAQIRGDGTFQTGPLAPGHYSVVVQPRDPMDPNGEVASVNVEVNGEDVGDLLIVTGRAGVVRGRIVSDDGSPLPFAPAQVRLFAQPLEPGRMAFGMRPPRVNDDWTFELTGLTEPVRLTAALGEVPGGGWVARHAWKDNVDLLDTALEIGPGQTVEDVELVLTRRVSELSGLVTDERGQPVTAASIVIFPEDRERWTFGSRYLRLARPDTNGKYSVRLTPNDGYRAIVVRALEEGQSSDPEFLTRALESATAFTLGDGETKVLNLKLAEVR